MYGSAGVGPAAAGLVERVAAGLGDDGANAEVLQVDALVEKPAPEDVLSEFALIGRYVLHPAVFDIIERTKPGAGGEIQLTDAIAELAKMPADQGGGVHGVVFRGRRYDTGDKLDYLKAVVILATQHPELGADFAAWLTNFAANPES
jgi:UTP--glucose-1-phosphate uridylyltransferase